MLCCVFPTAIADEKVFMFGGKPMTSSSKSKQVGATAGCGMLYRLWRVFRILQNKGRQGINFRTKKASIESSEGAREIAGKGV